MSGELPGSRDPDLGWISRQEVRNIWIEAMRELDKVIWPDRTSGSRDAVMKWLETIPYKMDRRMKANVEQFLPGYREPKKPRGAGDEPSAKSAHDQRIAALKQRSS